MSVNEKTLCLSFEIRMPHSSGLLNLAFPAVVANTILRRLTSDWGRRRRHAPEIRARMEASARRIRFGARCNCRRCGCRRARLRIPGAGNHSSLRPARQRLPEWRVGGQVVARAQAIRQGAHPGRAHRAARSRRWNHELFLIAGSSAAALFSPGAGRASRSWSSRCPEPLEAGSFGLPRRSAGTQRRFSMLLDAGDSRFAAAGRRDGPEGRLGRIAARGVRSRGGETARQDGRHCRVDEIRARRAESAGFAGLSAAIRRARLDDPGAR